MDTHLRLRHSPLTEDKQIGAEWMSQSMPSTTAAVSMNLTTHLSSLFWLFLFVALASASLVVSTAPEVSNTCIPTQGNYPTDWTGVCKHVYTLAPGESWQHHLHDRKLLQTHSPILPPNVVCPWFTEGHHELYTLSDDLFLSSPLPTDRPVYLLPAAPRTPLVPRPNRPPCRASSAIISVPLDGDDRGSSFATILQTFDLWELMSMVSAVAWLFVCLIA
ncbi:hypothetical protein BC628DRAFT_1418839 [Trametes gibbosa]|nr:hypothetical protein BC628DRAFT_1418839 [Trametes gibbosa]